MTSNDLTILEAINGLEGKIVAIQSEIQEVRQEIKDTRQEIKDTRNELMTEIRINQNDTAHLQTSVYWGFAIMGVVIGLVSFVVATIALLPYLRKEKSETKVEQKNFTTVEQVQNIVETAISRALAGISK